MSASKKKKSNKKTQSNKKEKVENINIECAEELNKDIKNSEENKKTEEVNIKTESSENTDKIEKKKSQKDKNEDKEEKKDKKEEKKEDVKSKNKETEEKEIEPTKELLPVKTEDEKPEYVLEMLKKKKRKTIIFILVVILVILIIAFSVIFALANWNSTRITKGISIKNLEVSNLSIEEAKEVLTSGLDKELIPDLNLEFNNEYKLTLSPEQIEFKYNIEEAIKEAYSIGRTENILLNNYTLLFTTLFGKNMGITYTYNEELLNQFIDDLNSKLPGLVVQPSYYIEDTKLIVEEGKDGIEVSKEELKKSILESFLNRSLEEVTKENYNQTIKIPTHKTKASSIDMDKVYSEIHCEPQDAYFELEPYKIYPDVDGVDLVISLDDAKKQITGKAQEYQFDLKITKANKTIKDLGTEAFPYLISSFSTRYDASNTNRSTNLRIAAEKINGTVLLPGEVFSYNKTVGKRTVEAGYKEAAGFSGGRVVPMLGGGICQVSSTLYDAVLYANLGIVERHNHMFQVAYIDTGKDATVVYGSLDFKFENTRKYPIMLQASARSGLLQIKVYGVKEEVEYDVEIVTKILNYTPYRVIYETDSSLGAGQERVAQAGIQGCKSITYKILKLNGVEVEQTVLSSDSYDPQNKIIKRGPTTPTSTTPPTTSVPKPTEPVTPTEPTTPVEPTIPETPTKPTTPTEPEKPSKPENPSEPTTPEEPAA